jgi:hypothetical protein
LKEQALDYMIWRTGCGGGYGYFIRWIEIELINEFVKE